MAELNRVFVNISNKGLLAACKPTYCQLAENLRFNTCQVRNFIKAIILKKSKCRDTSLQYLSTKDIHSPKSNKSRPLF